MSLAPINVDYRTPSSCAIPAKPKISAQTLGETIIAMILVSKLTIVDRIPFWKKLNNVHINPKGININPEKNIPNTPKIIPNKPIIIMSPNNLYIKNSKKVINIDILLVRISN